MDRFSAVAVKVAASGAYAKVVEVSADRAGFVLMAGYRFGAESMPADVVKFQTDRLAHTAVAFASKVERVVPCRLEKGLGTDLVVDSSKGGLVLKTWMQMGWTDGGAFFGGFSRGRECELEVARLAGLETAI